jgi:hypothetical protein
VVGSVLLAFSALPLVVPAEHVAPREPTTQQQAELEKELEQAEARAANLAIALHEANERLERAGESTVLPPITTPMIPRLPATSTVPTVPTTPTTPTIPSTTAPTVPATPPTVPSTTLPPPVPSVGICPHGYHLIIKTPLGGAFVCVRDRRAK